MDAGSPGGLGPRIARRRAELGLDRAQVAFRAGIDPGYLAYLEEHPAATARPATVRRLAVALATTWEALTGISFGDPAGSGPPAGSAEVAALSEETCYALIGPGGIGRLVFTSGRGPVALPVNFRVLGRDIVFRTGDGSIRAAVDAGGPAGFQVDRLDETLTEGWSVLATGHAAVVTDADGRRAVDALGIQSWAGEPCPVPVRFSVARADRPADPPACLTGGGKACLQPPGQSAA
jgi:transcriptional regulator with XRE-family HTH domain